MEPYRLKNTSKTKNVSLLFKENLESLPEIRTAWYFLDTKPIRLLKVKVREKMIWNRQSQFFKLYLISLFFCLSINLISFGNPPKGTLTPVLMGRLGNILFELSGALAYCWDHDLELRCPYLKYGNSVQGHPYLCECPPSDYSVVFSHLFELYPNLTDPIPPPTKVFDHRPIPFYVGPVDFPPNSLIYSFFFCEKFFLKYKDAIKNLFQPPDELNHVLYQKFGDILSDPQSVAIHYRSFKGDGDLIYCKLNKRFYQKALSHFSKDSIFYIFTNNKAHAKKFFESVPTKNPIIFLETDGAITDFYLMTKFKNLIIANSTFSWWAAYLNLNEDKKIVSPSYRRWFRGARFVKPSEHILPETENWVLE